MPREGTVKVEWRDIIRSLYHDGSSPPMKNDVWPNWQLSAILILQSYNQDNNSVLFVDDQSLVNGSTISLLNYGINLKDKKQRTLHKRQSGRSGV
jgi:hypothetical protein